MHIRKLLVLVLLGLSLTAAADFRTTTEVYEIDLPNLRLPGTEGGTLALKECDDCETQTLRGKPIEIGRRHPTDLACAIGAHISIAKIVSQHENNIWSLRLRRSCGDRYQAHRQHNREGESNV